MNFKSPLIRITLMLGALTLIQTPGFSENAIKFPLVTKSARQTREALNLILQKSHKDLIPESNTVNLGDDVDFLWGRLQYLQGLINLARGGTYFINTIETEGCFEGDAEVVAKNINKIKAIWLDEEFSVTSHLVWNDGNLLKIFYSDSSASENMMTLSRCL